MKRPSRPHAHIIARLGQLAFWAALIFAFVMATLPNPPELAGDNSDKFQHIAAFVTLAALASVGWPKATSLRIGLHLAAFGALIEFIQMIPFLHRDADIWDWVADIVATGAALLALSWARRLCPAIKRSQSELL